MKYNAAYNDLVIDSKTKKNSALSVLLTLLVISE